MSWSYATSDEIDRGFDHLGGLASASHAEETALLKGKTQRTDSCLSLQGAIATVGGSTAKPGGGPLFDDGNDLADGDRVTGFDSKIDNIPGVGCCDFVLHLHRLKHTHWFPGSHLFARLHMNLDDGPLHWGDNHAVGITG